MALARMAGLTVVVLVVLAAPAHAIRYAAPVPTGSGDCSSAANACRIEAAVEGQASAPAFGAAAAGEEIVVLPGEHVLSGSLNVVAAVNIHGVLGQPKPTLRRTGGTSPLVTSNMAAPGVLRHLRIHGTGITDGFNPVLSGDGDATYSELEVIADGTTAAAVRLSDGALLRSSTARQGGATGLAIGVGTTGTSRIVGVTAVAQGAAAYGLVMYDFGNAANDVFGAHVRNSIIRGGTYDLMVAASGASNDIELQIGHSDYGETVVSGPGAQLTNQGGNLAATAQLTNIASGDFHQLVTSPTRDAGTTDPDLGALDVDGEPRASGAAPDIGADEWYMAPPPVVGDPPPAPPTDSPPPPKPRACAMRKTGSRKDQTLRGGRLGDLLSGLGGNDVLRGLAGADCLNGGKGNDLLIGGPGVDRFSGGPGKDRIVAKDGTRESVDCGPGRDSVLADRKDRLRRCERVKRR